MKHVLIVESRVSYSSQELSGRQDSNKLRTSQDMNLEGPASLEESAKDKLEGNGPSPAASVLQQAAADSVNERKPPRAGKRVHNVTEIYSPRLKTKIIIKNPQFDDNA